MPVTPSTYTPGPVSPQQLNADLYSFDGNNFHANGIAFHSRRPLVTQTVLSGGTTYAQLSQNPVSVPGINAFAEIDTTALYGIGSDRPGVNAQFNFQNNVQASGGTAGAYGGWWLSWGFPNLGAVSVPPAGVGGGMELGAGTFVSMGTFQYGWTGGNNIPWFLDLISPQAGSIQTWKPAFWWLTPSVPVVEGNQTDTAGGPTRMGWLWASTGSGPVAGSVPSPQANWGTVTSAALNSGVGSVLTFLNNPPVLRVSSAAGQSLTSGTNTILQFPNSPNADNYSGWSTAVSNYTAPLSGLYLFSPTTIYGTASATGLRYSGLQTNAGGTVVDYQGPVYKATPVGPGVSGVGLTGTSVVRVFNLNAGDKIAAYGFQNSGAGLSLYNGFASRLVGSYMSPVAAAGTVLTYTPPNPSFRWQAGALSGTALTAALNTHLGSDLAFLMNKPYFTGYQQTAQTGFSVDGHYYQITMDTLGALPRGGNGDNYGGWSSANHWYVSQVPGWYVTIADLYPTAPVSGTAGVVTGGFFVSSSGSITPSSTPDTYHRQYYPASGGAPPGVTCLGVYYLLPGEYVYPVMAIHDWGGAGGTYTDSSTAATIYSQFSAFYVSE
jgi:hypothetical protein